MAWTVTIQSITPEKDHLVAELGVSDGSTTFMVDVPLNVDWSLAQAKFAIKEYLVRQQTSIEQAAQAQAFIGQSFDL